MRRKHLRRDAGRHLSHFVNLIPQNLPKTAGRNQGSKNALAYVVSGVCCSVCLLQIACLISSATFGTNAGVQALDAESSAW